MSRQCILLSEQNAIVAIVEIPDVARRAVPDVVQHGGKLYLPNGTYMGGATREYFAVADGLCFATNDLPAGVKFHSLST
jgi:hypothetical protein